MPAGTTVLGRAPAADSPRGISYPGTRLRNGPATPLSVDSAGADGETAALGVAWGAPAPGTPAPGTELGEAALPALDFWLALPSGVTLGVGRAVGVDAGGGGGGRGRVGVGTWAGVGVD